MAKTQGKAAGGKVTAEGRPATLHEGGAEMLGGGNLDQVREILFGAQNRGIEKRVSRLEEELPKRVADMREELKRGIATLEAYARREIDSLNERLRGEIAERDKGDDQLSSKAEESAKALRREIANLDERSTGAQRELRQHLLDQTKRLDDEIQRRSDDLAAALAKAVEELRSEKADRKAVAGILHEVAMRLTDEFSLPLGADAEP
jgi:DNA repair exonuclease SbcCD ATPase subunit